MDPNTALTSILHGHMLLDHVEALRDWLRGGGFAPEMQLMPCDKHPFFAAHCERTYGDARGYAIDVKADERGIWTQDATERKNDDWTLCASWRQLEALAACEED